METSEQITPSHKSRPPGKNWEIIPKRVATRLKPRLESFLEQRVGKLIVVVQNPEELAALKDSPFILVANHPKPTDRVSLLSGLSPDSFILHEEVKKITGKELHFLAHYGEGVAPWLKSIPDGAAARIKMIHKGLLKGVDALSVDTTPGVLPFDFVREAQKVLTQGHPLLIYPYGDWHEDEDLVGHVQRGASFMARRAHVPILPVYIQGARTWKAGEKSRVIIGNHFTTDGLTDDQVKGRIQDSILNLKQTP